MEVGTEQTVDLLEHPQLRPEATLLLITIAKQQNVQEGMKIITQIKSKNKIKTYTENASALLKAPHTYNIPYATHIFNP